MFLETCKTDDYNIEHFGKFQHDLQNEKMEEEFTNLKTALVTNFNKTPLPFDLKTKLSKFFCGNFYFKKKKNMKTN